MHSQKIDPKPKSMCLQEYLKMPRETIQMLVLSAEKEAVKRFLSQVHQSWDQLDVELQVQ